MCHKQSITSKVVSSKKTQKTNKQKTAPHSQIFIKIVLELSISYLLDFCLWKTLYEEKLPNLFSSFSSSISHATHTISKPHCKYRQF